MVKMKIKSRVMSNYSKLGEIPGVLVDRVAREKVLKDLGHKSTSKEINADENEEEKKGEEPEESKVATEVSMVT